MYSPVLFLYSLWAGRVEVLKFRPFVGKVQSFLTTTGYGHPEAVWQG
jgi:hypothetical protein